MSAQRFALNLFGSFEAQYDGRPLTDFATDKIRALFAYLGVESDKPHRRETLAGLLWPDYPDAVARRNLRQSLHRLRQTLHKADPALPDRLIAQTRQTITLKAETITLDTDQFAQLRKEAKTTPNPISLLTQIADLYQGEFLTGFSISDAYAFDEWLTIQRELFHQQALDALSQLISIHEARGDQGAVLATAGRLLALDPWHEQTHRQIMRAHAGRGNRPQAVAQYNKLKAILLREIGVAPAPSTTALYEQIRAETPPAGEPHRPTTQYQFHQFPAPLTPIIGREPELKQLVQTLQDPDCRLVTITGPGGMGKTRLCIETARRLAAGANRFRDGLVFIPLAQLQHGELLFSTVAQSLNLSFQHSPDPQRELLNHLKHKQILLVLDNFEHLLLPSGDESLPVAIAFLVETLTSIPGPTFLITSREPLTIRGEWLFNLEGLSYTAPIADGSILDLPAPQLFIQNARRYRPAFDPQEHTVDIDAILEICRLTNGLPLALEIAAAWMRAYSCPEIAQQIAQSLDFLTSPHRDVPARQRSIRAIIASTWDQLSPEQQSVIAAMSVFPGRFSVQAAVSVAQASVLDMAILVEKSLLRRAGERRYELHELLRQFAAEKLLESGDEQEARTRHAEFYFRFLSKHIAGFSGTNPQEAISTVRRAIDDIRASWHWAAAHAQIDLLNQVVDGFALFLILTGSSREGEEAYEHAFNALQQTGSDSFETISLQSRLAARLAWFQVGMGKHGATRENATRAVALADRCRDALSRAYGLSILGWALQIQAEYEEAEAALTEAVDLFNQAGKPLEASLALIRLGSLYWRKRDFEKALTFYQRSLRIEQRLQNKRGINRAYGGIGLVYRNLGRYDEALEWLSGALAIDRELGNRFGVTRHLGNIGSVYYDRGDYAQSLTYYQEAARIEQETEHVSTLAIWLAAIGNAYGKTGETRLALRYYDQAIALNEELSDRYSLCAALLGKGEVLLHRADYTMAKPLIERGRQLADEVQRKDSQFRARLLSARLLAKMAQPNKARQELAIMLSALDDGENTSDDRATIYYELWLIENEIEYARQALIAYQLAFARAPKGEYRLRIDELSNSLSAQTNI